MLWISDSLLIKHSKDKSSSIFEKFINDKRFTVSDTPLTYRQTRTLDKDNLLPKDPDRKRGWRKYSFKELIYVLLVSELKQFGLLHEQLRVLWECFFGKDKAISDFVMGCVFRHFEILLVVDKNGLIGFYDAPHFLLLGSDKTSLLIIKVNDIVNKLLIHAGKKTVPVEWSIQSVYLEAVNADVTDKEQVLLDILRNNDYSTIRIKKSDGQIGVIYAGKNSINTGDITPEELKKIVSEKDFQDINIIKRDGKIVNLTVEETIKP